jgi:hypothetical protein
MLFEVEIHPNNVDTASFLLEDLNEYKEEDIAVISMSPREIDPDELDADVALLQPSNNNSLLAITQGLQEGTDTNLTNVEKRHSMYSFQGRSRYNNWLGVKQITTAPEGSKKNKDINNSNNGAPKKDSFAEKSARLRKASPYGHLPGWRLE